MCIYNIPSPALPLVLVRLTTPASQRAKKTRARAGRVLTRRGLSRASREAAGRPGTGATDQSDDEIAFPGGAKRNLPD